MSATTTPADRPTQSGASATRSGTVVPPRTLSPERRALSWRRIAIGIAICLWTAAALLVLARALAGPPPPQPDVTAMVVAGLAEVAAVTHLTDPDGAALYVTHAAVTALTSDGAGGHHAVVTTQVLRRTGTGYADDGARQVDVALSASGRTVVTATRRP